MRDLLLLLLILCVSPAHAFDIYRVDRFSQPLKTISYIGGKARPLPITHTEDSSKRAMDVKTMGIVGVDNNSVTKIIDKASAVKTFECRTSSYGSVDAEPTISDSIWQVKRIVVSGKITTTLFAGDGLYNQSCEDRDSLFPATVAIFSNTKSVVTDGVDEFIDWGSIANFERTQAFSVSIWVKNSNSGFQHFINRIQGSSPFRGWQVYKDTAQKLTFSLINTAGSNTIQSNGDSTVLNDGAWHHIVVTYDGSSNGSGVKMYIDSNPETVSVTTDSLSATTLHATPVLVGKRTDGVGHVVGNIDEPAIYTDVLTPVEVTEIYNSGNPIDLTSLASGNDLLAWIRFTQTDIDNFPTIADHSGNANGGTANNMESSDIASDVP